MQLWVLKRWTTSQTFLQAPGLKVFFPSTSFLSGHLFYSYKITASILKGLVYFPPFSPLQTKLPTSSQRKHEQNLWIFFFFYDVAVFLSVFFLTVFRKYPVHAEDYPPGQPPALCYSRGPAIVLLFVGLGRTQRYRSPRKLEPVAHIPSWRLFMLPLTDSPRDKSSACPNI